MNIEDVLENVQSLNLNIYCASGHNKSNIPSEVKSSVSYIQQSSSARCRPACHGPLLPSYLPQPALLCPRHSPCRAWASASSSWWHPWLLVVWVSYLADRKQREKRGRSLEGLCHTERWAGVHTSCCGSAVICAFFLRGHRLETPNTFLEVTPKGCLANLHLFF